MGLNKYNTMRLLCQGLLKYRQYQSGIRPSHKNKTNKKTIYVITKTPLPVI